MVPASNDFILTLSGRKLYPNKPAEFEPNIDDIAHALALQCRFNGHVQHFYSVAQHSLNCLDIARTLYALGGDKNGSLYILLHDAAEAYIGDIIRPVKHLCFEEFKQLEQPILDKIYQAFGVTETPYLQGLLRVIDDRMCATESFYLCAEKMPKYIQIYGVLKPDSFDVQDPASVKAAFIEAVGELSCI